MKPSGYAICFSVPFVFYFLVVWFGYDAVSEFIPHGLFQVLVLILAIVLSAILALVLMEDEDE